MIMIMLMLLGCWYAHAHAYSGCQLATAYTSMITPCYSSLAATPFNCIRKADIVASNMWFPLLVTLKTRLLVVPPVHIIDATMPILVWRLVCYAAFRVRYALVGRDRLQPCYYVSYVPCYATHVKAFHHKLLCYSCYAVMLRYYTY
jgi:hypothetical protein